MTERFCAKIENNAIVEYPVTIETINERNNPADTYVWCFLSEKPQYNPLTSYLVDKPTLVDSAVYVLYEIKNKTLEEVFAELAQLTSGSVSSFSIADIPPPVFNLIINLIKEKVQDKLDVYAKSFGYDNIHTMCGYIGSKIDTYKNEAIAAIDIRDTVWSTLYSYLSSVLNGSEPIPLSWEEIDSKLPVTIR